MKAWWVWAWVMGFLMLMSGNVLAEQPTTLPVEQAELRMLRSQVLQLQKTVARVVSNLDTKHHATV